MKWLRRSRRVIPLFSLLIPFAGPAYGRVFGLLFAWGICLGLGWVVGLADHGGARRPPSELREMELVRLRYRVRPPRPKPRRLPRKRAAAAPRPSPRRDHVTRTPEPGTVRRALETPSLRRNLAETVEVPDRRDPRARGETAAPETVRSGPGGRERSSSGLAAPGNAAHGARTGAKTVSAADFPGLSETFDALRTVAMHALSEGEQREFPGGLIVQRLASDVLVKAPTRLRKRESERQLYRHLRRATDRLAQEVRRR